MLISTQAEDPLKAVWHEKDVSKSCHEMFQKCGEKETRDSAVQSIKIHSSEGIIWLMMRTLFC